MCFMRQCRQAPHPCRVSSMNYLTKEESGAQRRVAGPGSQRAPLGLQLEHPDSWHSFPEKLELDSVASGRRMDGSLEKLTPVLQEARTGVLRAPL